MQTTEITIESVNFEMIEQRAAYQIFLDYQGIEESEEAAENFRDSYAGTWPSAEAWAEDFLESTGELAHISEHFRPYFDYQAWARDAEMNGGIWTANVPAGIAVFWDR